MQAQLNTTPKYSAYNFIWHNGYSKSTVTMVPLTDLKPLSEPYIYSTLLFVKNQSKNLNVDVPCITFDQRPWYKVNKIINDKNLNMVSCLGGFHTLIPL